MIKKIVVGLVVLILGFIMITISQAAEDKQVPARYGVFKQLQAKGHEQCYVAELGNGVLAAVMFGNEGPVKDKPMAMELIFTEDAYNKLAEKPENAIWHKDLKIYSKHFYAHETPQPMHMEQGTGGHQGH